MARRPVYSGGVPTPGNRKPPHIVPGQRWLSEAERDLGIGTIVDVDDRSLVVAFVEAGESKRYAIRSAPLRRVRFAAGDSIVDKEGRTLRIDDVVEADGLLTYLCDGEELPEYEIADTVSLMGPRERLLSGRTSKPHRFALRLEALARLHDIRRSPVRGFVGPRLELLPHQFFIASEVASRATPRVLLADETGLGKTIEACLSINRLIATGRASRVLILTPDSLVHQWLVEQRRRFNLRFALFDEDRCGAAEGSVAGANPFSSEQLVLAGLGLVTSSSIRTQQAADAGWDVVVVDEAHHLVREGENSSPEYAAVQAIAANSRGLLLLTATPQQLGERSHFARLHLLDPQRYDDFDRWKKESDRYGQVAGLGRCLIDGATPSEDDYRGLGEVLGESPESIAESLANADGRSEVLSRLIDRHGPGRAMFRNTRSAMPRFPEREIHVHGLPAAADTKVADRLAKELALDLGLARVTKRTRYDLADDPRIEHLLAFLSESDDSNVLVFCSNAAKAQAIKDAIDAKRGIDIALFHEDLNVVQRDRNAAWFAEPDGARVMICSEIGSEGRNFQHAQNMMMFDLPLDPDLVEQRIGRLDRIGQRGVVRIDVPYVEGGGMEALVRWHHEGIGVFARPTTSAQALLERFGNDVVRIVTSGAPEADEMDAIIEQTSRAHTELAAVVEQGRDLLLEMASLRQPRADELVDAVSAAATDGDFEDFALRLLDAFHVYAEEIAPRCYQLNPDALRAVELPSLEGGRRTITFDREVALVREDFEFFSWDHPLITDAIEHLCSGDTGNACFAVIEGPKPARMLLETVFVLEAIAPPSLHCGRFLPPTPIRVVSDHKGRAVDDADDLFADASLMTRAPTDWVVQRQSTLRDLLETMLTTANKSAEKKAEALRDEAARALETDLLREVDRLRELARVNEQVDASEVDEAERELENLRGHVGRSRLRLDCVRLLWIGPPLST